MGRYCAAAPYRASEKYRFRRKSVGSACRIMQLLHMFGVITSYANYLHLFSILGGIFRPFSLIPTGKYIKYVPSGPRLVVSKPAPLKSKGLQVGRLSPLLVLLEREVRICPVRPVCPVYLLRSYFCALTKRKTHPAGSQRKSTAKTHFRRPDFRPAYPMRSSLCRSPPGSST